MRKILAAILTTCAAAVGAFTYFHFAPMEMWHDQEGLETEGDDDAGPPDGDYWITRNTYPTGNFDAQWVIDAATQERQMAAQVPAGAKTYDKSKLIDSPLALDPGGFIPLGPMPENNTQMSYGSVSGRSNVIRVDPTTTTPGSITVYSGSDGGGIWKTTNCCTSATTWQVVTDVPEVSSMSISDIAIDPHNHSVIYAGTGDLNFGSFSFGASGVLKSADAGQTWDLLGATVFTPYYPGSFNSFPQYQAVGKVAVDPNNSNIVLAGTKTSLFMSYDGGANWTGPCFTNPYALPNNAASTTAQRQDVTGLIPVDNGDGTTRLYVAIGTRGAATPVQPDLVNTGSNGVYVLAKIPASGCPAINSWTLLNTGWPVGTGNGVAGATQVGRIEIAVAPSNPQRMYAQTEHQTNKNIEGIYRSDNAGATWTQLSANGVNADATNMGCGDSVSSKGGAQMWYDAGLTVDPNDPNRVYMSTTDLNLSTDAGANFRDVTCGWTTNHSLNGGVRVHVDQHARAFVGNDSSQMLIGTDGGVYYSSNANADSPAAASGSSLVKWIELNDTINSIEFYFGDIAGNFATAPVPAIGAGAQDNGCSAAHFAAAPTGPVQWTATCGGDGTTTKIEPVFNKVYFNSSQNGALARNLTYGTTFSGTFSTVSANTGGTWGGDPVGSIFAMSYDLYKWGAIGVANSGCDATNGCNHMIAGTTRLWETIDAMNPTTATMRSSWKARTPDLTKDSLNSPAGDIRSYINYVAYSFTDPTIAAVATNDGNVQIVFGLGTAVAGSCPLAPPATSANCANAVNVTDSNNILPNRPIFGVRFDPTTALVAYAAVGGFNANTPGRPGHLFQVTCTANCASFAWKDKTGNLPDIPAEQVMPNPNLPNQVFVGTDWGLYYTDDITADPPQWYRFEDFPHAMVWELVVDRGFTTLAAFTRSRGAWVWPLPNAALGPSADLVVTNTGPATVAAGSTVAYTIGVSNNGPNTASNVVVNDPTPAGLSLVSVSGDCAALPCNFASLGNGASKMATVTFAVPAAYDTANAIANIATTSSDASDPAPASNSATATTAVTATADLALSMSGPTSVARGTTASYTIVLTNGGPSTARNVSVADATPTGLVFVSTSGDCVTAFPCTFASLDPGVPKQITVTFSIPAGYADGSPVANIASVTSDASDPAGANNSAEVDTSVTDSADVAISQVGTGAVQAGNSVSYTIALTNNGPSAASSVVVDDPTPSGLNSGSVSGDCASFPCSFASLAPGDVKTVTVTFGVPSDYAGNQIANVANVTSATDDPNLNNNIASAYTTVGAGADLQLTLTAPATAPVGSRVAYTFILTNNGPSTANDVQLDDTLAAGLVFAGNSGDCTGAFPCTFGTLQPGDTRTVTTTACVPSDYTGSYLLKSSGTASSSSSDPYMGNNAAAAYTSLLFDVIFADGFETCP
ncbi:MAG: DUF11 domain-containing protein [Rudaea sp.]|nr:DUF11 domain-containing protein [Rudaea sp.]